MVNERRPVPPPRPAPAERPPPPSRPQQDTEKKTWNQKKLATRAVPARSSSAIVATSARPREVDFLSKSGRFFSKPSRKPIPAQPRSSSSLYLPAWSSSSRDAGPILKVSGQTARRMKPAVITKATSAITLDQRDGSWMSPGRDRMRPSTVTRAPEAMVKMLKAFRSSPSMSACCCFHFWNATSWRRLGAS